MFSETIYVCVLTRDLSKHFNLCPFFGRRLSFIRDQSDCKVTVFVAVACDLGQSPVRFSEVKRSK